MANKFNKTVKYDAILEVLRDSGLTEVRGIPMTDLVDLCENEQAIIARKAASTSAKVDPAKMQFRADVLSAVSALTEPSIVSDIMKVAPLANIVGLQNQKVSRYLNDLVDEGLVTKTVIKKQSFFSLA